MEDGYKWNKKKKDLRKRESWLGKMMKGSRCRHCKRIVIKLYEYEGHKSCKDCKKKYYMRME